MDNNTNPIIDFEDSGTSDIQKNNKYLDHILPQDSMRRKVSIRRHENKGNLYRVFILDKNITSIPSAQFQLIDAFVDLVTTPHTEETEKERSSLIEALKKFLNKYGSEGFELLKTYIEILLKSEQETLISDILEIIGESENPDSKNDRRIYLEDQLIKNKKQKIRYGALLGLENIESQQSIPALRQALRDEDVPVLRELIHEILRLLR